MREQGRSIEKPEGRVSNVCSDWENEFHFSLDISPYMRYCREVVKKKKKAMKEIKTQTGKSTIFVYEPPNPYHELAYKAEKAEREAKEAVREADRRKLFLHDRLVALKKNKGVQKLNGSLLVDEKGYVMQVVPVVLSNGKKCFGLRSVETLKV